MKQIHRPFIIDVEASGFGPQSYPIEIGLALGKDERYCSLIAPLREWTHWDEKAEAVHQIPRRLLFDFGRPVHEVAMELNRILQRITVFSDAWGVDRPWISKLFDRAGIRKSFHVSPLERILTEEQMEIWHQTRRRIENDLNLERHRASSDAFIIQETYVRTRNITIT